MAYQFKVGDKVRIINYDGYTFNGKFGIIQSFFKDTMGKDYSSILIEGYSCLFSFYNDHLELVVENLINNKTNLMKLNTMMKKLLDINTKKLIKAGILDGNLLLTDLGKEALQAIEVEANKEELLKVADEIIAEEEKK